MNFSLSHSIEILERTPDVLESLLSGLSEEWTYHNEGEKTWSAYDIVGHLIHGEHTDWMSRLQIIFSDSGDKKFKPFDRFAQFEESKGKTLKQLLNEFRLLREKNLAALKNYEINEDTLKRTGIHPDFGEVTLKELLSTWVVHDLNHLAQVARVMAKQYRNEVGPWVKYLPVLTK